jgi:D-alanyl-D-alanine carboxypeptidase
MASLTKMMTALVTLQLVKEYEIDMKTTYFPVDKVSAATIGTTAHL